MSYNPFEITYPEKQQRCSCGLTLSNNDLWFDSAMCEGCTMKTKPKACQDCFKEAVWIKAFSRWNIVDCLCEECYEKDMKDAAEWLRKCQIIANLRKAGFQI